MTMTDERLAGLDVVMATATAVMRSHEAFLLTHDLDMHGACPDEALDEIAGEVDAAQRDLRAHIDAQAATIARQDESLRQVQALITEVMDLERIGAAQAIEEMAQIVNAALTGAA